MMKQLCNIFFLACSSARIFFLFHLCCMQFFLPTRACRKFFFEIIHTPPQELNGRPLSTLYCQNRSLPSNGVSCIHNIFVRNRFKLAFINTTEIVLQLYLFPLLFEVACFVIKSAIIIFVFCFTNRPKYVYICNFPRYKVIFSSRVYLESQPTAE